VPPLVALLTLLAAQDTVPTARELRDAAARAKPGATLLVAPGDYDGGLHLSDLKGAPGKPIVIAGADPKNPPVFKGGATGLQLSAVAHVELRDLVITGATANGLNIDDAGRRDAPSRHVTLRRITVRDVGAGGNQDGIKLSGLDDFRVEECTVLRWGRGGSAVDMVGCHRGVIEACAFTHDEGAGGGGVQMKGGCAEIAVRRCRF
jgi:hypothetical protein